MQRIGIESSGENLVTSQKVVLYTCIINKRDKPKKLQYKEDFDYVLFTDDPDMEAPDWDIRPLVWETDDPVRSARYHKHHPVDLFPDHEVSIWLDATHWPYASLLPILELGEISAVKHFSRSSIAEEVEACIEGGLDDVELMRDQVDRYSFPDDQLYSTTCLIRHHTQSIIDFQKLWWFEIQNGSRRDQLSFTYCLWKSGIECATIPGFCRKKPSNFFKMVSHYKKDILFL